MESPLAGNLHSIQEKVIKELVQGRGLAVQLQIILHELTGFGRGSATAEDLVTRILRSFTEALSILSSNDSGKFPTSSPCWNHRRTSEEIPTSKDQSRKRAKIRNMQETWTRITSMPIEDGYAWRKYGQKGILNAKHLRCYFRCTYRFDQGCQATKQVQRTEDETPKFWTKYMGHHTCQDVLKASIFILDSTAEEGVLLNFESNTTTKQEPIFLSSFPSSKEEQKKSFPSIEQEYKSSSSKYLPPQALTKFKSSPPTSASPSTSKMGQEDVVSGGSSSSSCSFDMDMELIDSFYLSDVFYDEELF